MNSYSRAHIGRIIAIAASTVVGCSSLTNSYRSPPDPPDDTQLYEDFGDFRITSYYPRVAAESGQEGWVMLEFSVGVDGCISNVSVVDSSPPGYFEEAAMSGFVDFCFEHPKLIDGMPVVSLSRPYFISYQLEE